MRGEAFCVQGSWARLEQSVRPHPAPESRMGRSPYPCTSEQGFGDVLGLMRLRGTFRRGASPVQNVGDSVAVSQPSQDKKDALRWEVLCVRQELWVRL